MLLYKPHITNVMAVNDRLVLPRFLDNLILQQIQTHSFTLLVLPSQIIHLSLMWQQNDGLDYITVCDGPGDQSLIIMSINKTVHSGFHETTTSAFTMYILVQHTNHSLNLANFSVKFLNSKQRHICKVKHFYAKKDVFDSFFLASYSINGNFVCGVQSASTFSYWPYPNIYLKELVFSGANTLDSLFNQGCNYGGIFMGVFDTNSPFTNIARCENLMHFFWYPNQTSIIELFVIWYSGYSHGRKNGQKRYRHCPITHLSTYSLLANFIFMFVLKRHAVSVLKSKRKLLVLVFSTLLHLLI